jgi:lysophospholipase L1-like esterase
VSASDPQGSVRPPISRRRKAAILAILTSVTLVVFLGILEGGARLLGYLPASVKRFDSERGWTYEPNSAFQFVTIHGRVRVSVDGEGFRPLVAGKEDTGSPLIVCVGDSYTFCEESADDRTWPERLALELSGKGYRCRAMNRGMTGYSPLQSLAALRHELRRDGGAPGLKAVVYFFCINDPQEIFQPDRPHWDPADFSRPPASPGAWSPNVIPPAPPAWSLASQWKRFKGRFAFIKAVRYSSVDGSVESFKAGGGIYMDAFLPHYQEFLGTPSHQEGMRAALRELRQECASRGVPLFVAPVIMPAWDRPGESRGELAGLLGWSGEKMDAQASAYHSAIDLLGKLAGEAGATFIDLRGTLDGMKYREYAAAPLDWHFSAEANGRIGKALAEGLLPHLAGKPR